MEALKETLKVYVKKEARGLIALIASEWRQRNHLARAIELQELRNINGHLTDDEQYELDFSWGIFKLIKSIRTASDDIEIEIDSGNIMSKDEIVNHILWP